MTPARPYASVVNLGMAGCQGDENSGWLAVGARLEQWIWLQHHGMP